MFDKPKIYNCYFDGATSKTNPSELLGIGGWLEYGGKKIYDFYGPVKEYGSNNTSEYISLKFLLQRSYKEVDSIFNFYGDSNLCIKQMNNEWRIKEGLYSKYAEDCKSLFKILSNVNTYSFKWIPREQNKEADRLSKLGLTVEEIVENYY